MTKRSKLIKFDISLSEEQSNAKEHILKHPFSFIDGGVGSGKTLLAVQVALDLFFKKEIEKIIITRPTVGTEDNGYLPGSYIEKMEPWMVPIRDNMRKVYNHPDILNKMEMDGHIELVSLAHFRGRTFENCVCIIDEYQNLTSQQLRMAIGRLGKNARMIFCGDSDQIDLKHYRESAIFDVMKIKMSKYVYHTTLSENYRHAAVVSVLSLLVNH